jgi:hypothetical protein
MITKNDIRVALDAADIEFRWCWDVVTSMHSLDAGNREGIPQFQIRLLDALAALERIYRVLKQEERRNVARKAHLNSTWFRRRMSTSASYREIIIRALEIGRAIGDGFAWFFYERDRDLILQHSKLQRQKLLPPDLGGIGERLVLESMQVTDQHLLIYHGTTSFLRLADVSIVDLKTLRVVGLGEIKTARIDDETVNVSISIIGNSRQDLPRFKVKKAPAGSAHKPVPPISESMSARGVRQLATLKKAFKSAREPNGDKRIAEHSQFHYDALEDIVTRCGTKSISFALAGRSMAIGALRLGNSISLGARFFDNQTRRIDRTVKGSEQWALKILAKGLPHNALSIGSLFAEPGSLALRANNIPIALWPIPVDVIRDVLFGHVLVVTFFNPGHLAQELETRGFKVKIGSNGRLKSAVRHDGGKIVELEHLDYFVEMIRSSLMSEGSVISMIDQLIEMTISTHGHTSARIELQPRIHRFGPKPNEQ